MIYVAVSSPWENCECHLVLDIGLNYDTKFSWRMFYGSYIY